MWFGMTYKFTAYQNINEAHESKTIERCRERSTEAGGNDANAHVMLGEILPELSQTCYRGDFGIIVDGGKRIGRAALYCSIVTLIP